MKTFAGGLAAHYALDSTTLCQCVRFELAEAHTDASVFAYTTAQVDVEVDGLTYLAGPGLDIGEIASAAGMAVDNLELTILPDDDGGTITRADLLTGKWNGAAFEIFETSFVDPSIGVNILKTGTLGEVRLDRGRFVVELRSLAQALQQPLGAVTSKTCRYRLGDAGCTLALGPFTHAGTVSAVTSQQVFTASALAQAADYFVEGTVEFTSGDNDGYTQKCKVFTSGKVFTLSLPMPYAIQIGDTFSAVAGCQKRLAEDCATKFSNVLNFGGEPHLPGIDALTSPPVVDVP